MSSTSNRNRDLELEAATPEEVAALRAARISAPSWLSLDWRVIDELLPPSAKQRPQLAQTAWRPFTLD